MSAFIRLKDNAATTNMRSAITAIESGRRSARRTIHMKPILLRRRPSTAPCLTNVVAPGSEAFSAGLDRAISHSLEFLDGLVYATLGPNNSGGFKIFRWMGGYQTRASKCHAVGRRLVQQHEL